MLQHGRIISRLALLGAWSFLLSSSPALASTIVVQPAIGTIQNAIDQASNGDTVLVPPGTYTGSGNRGLDFHGKNIVVRSSGGSDVTIIDCQDQNRALFLHALEPATAVFEGFTIVNGGGVSRGAGIYFESGASATLRDVVVVDCLAGIQAQGPNPPVPFALGGGFYCGANCQPRVEHVRISRNLAWANDARGGGIYCSETSVPLFVHCEIDSNDTRVPDNGNGEGWESGPGGGMYCATGAAVDVDSCRFVSNKGVMYGGDSCGPTGAAIRCAGNNQLSIRNSVFEQNNACGKTVDGGEGTDLYVADCTFLSNSGGLALGHAGTLHLLRTQFTSNLGEREGGALTLTGCNAWVTDCEFRGNTASSWPSTGEGGAIHCDDGAMVELDRCGISGNVAVRDGGAICVRRSSLTLRHSTLSGNSANLHCGGVFAADSATVEIEHSVIWGNCAYNGAEELSLEPGSSATLVCSAVRPGETEGNAIAQGPQIATDPGFCDPPRCAEAPTDGGTLFVAGNSPCLPSNNPCGELVGLRGAGCAESGACCTEETACFRMSPEACTSLGGVFLGDLACLPNPCGGACCLDDGSCSFLTESACEDASGIFKGSASTCDVNSCPPAGACCLPNNGCAQLNQAACLEAGGTYLADQLECPPYPCGPNRGGVLTFHTNPSLAYTTGQNYCGQSPLASCDQAISRTDATVPQIVSVLAAFPGAPVLGGVSFGIGYDAQQLAIIGYGNCADHELATAGWPAPSTGTTILWDQPRTTPLVEVYWFAAYTYDSAPARLRLEQHPTAGATFVSPSLEKDVVACLGQFGFHMDGMPCCPASAVGACCVTNGSCSISTAAACDDAGGQFFGVGSDCVPLPCPSSDTPEPSSSQDLVTYRGVNPVSISDSGEPIRFELSLRERALVRVRVFGAAGQLIRTVFDETLESGPHPLAFRPAELRFAAGVYYFEVQVGAERRTRKLVVTR